MDPITIMALFSAATSLAKQLIPQIQELMRKGEITPEQQAKLLAEFKSLGDHAKFTGKEWETTH